MKGKRAYLLLAGAVLLLDQWTKWLVETHLAERSIHTVVPGLLNFTHVRNMGVAFGLLAGVGEGGPWLLSLLGLLALTVVLVYFRQTPAEDRLLLTSLGLILGGAVGNLADRLVSGAVTDFIDLYYGTYHWHTFNVADSAITVGIGLMAADILRARRNGSPVDSK